MKLLFFSTREFEKKYILSSVPDGINVGFVKDRLCMETISLAKDHEAVSIFTADDCGADEIAGLAALGVKFIAVRASGYDNVDLKAVSNFGLKAANVPDYSPYSIAEHTVALALGLNRKLLRANAQVRQHDFTLDNLIGFDLHKKTVGIIGTGKIGSIAAKIFHGFGCTLLAHDIKPNRQLEVKYNVFYTGLNTLCSMCDIITIHVPLTNATRYMIDNRLITQMKKGVMLINTARGAVIKTDDIVNALSTGQIAYLGLDVYDKEKGVFFSDHSGEDLHDETLELLINHPRVLLTPHQGFATHEALQNIAAGTFENVMSFYKHENIKNEIRLHELIHHN